MGFSLFFLRMSLPNCCALWITCRNGRDCGRRLNLCEKLSMGARCGLSPGVKRAHWASLNVDIDLALNRSGTSNGAIGTLRRLWRQMSKRRRRQFFGLLVLVFFGAIAEAAMLAALLPFLARIADPDAIGNQSFIAQRLAGFRLADTHDSLLTLTVMFSAVVVIAERYAFFLPGPPILMPTRRGTN